MGLARADTAGVFNSCVLIDREGEVLGQYDKTHMFGDVDLAQFTPGAHLSTIHTLAGWKVGLAICYDIEFPEVARDLALRGAEMILVPTANMHPFETVATQLVPARAEENGVGVAYCNYVGEEKPFAYNGLSCVCGPDGGDIARANRQEETLLFATLDRATLNAARSAQTHLQDRRTDLYGKHS